MLRVWTEKQRMWSFGMVLSLGDSVAFGHLHFGPWQLTAGWIDDRVVDRLCDRLMERLREDV